MMPNLPLAAYDPLATPDWRWSLARRLAPDLRRLRREHRVDPPLLAAIAHLRGCPDADIAAALRLHETDGVLRWAVAACLLAGLDDAEIACRTKLAPSVVAAYEAICWDVRRRLGCTDWLLRRCVGPAAWRGFRRDEVRQLLAYAAIVGGPLLVDQLAAPVLRAGAGRPTLDAYQQHGLDPRLQRWVAAKAEPVAGVDPAVEIEALRNLVDLAKWERSERAGVPVLPHETGLAALPRLPAAVVRSRPAAMVPGVRRRRSVAATPRRPAVGALRATG